MIVYFRAKATTCLKYSLLMTTDVGLLGELRNISFAFFATSLGIAFRSGRNPFFLTSGMRCATPPAKLVATG